MRNWALSAFAIWALATPAIAAPNHTVWVEDTLFAQTDDSLLILRTVHDNGASYYTRHLDTFLVTLSRSDGSVQSIEPVERATTFSVGDAETDGTTYTILEGAVNPYARRADLNGDPLIDPPFSWRTIEIIDGNLILSETDTITHQAAMAPLMDQIIASVVQTRALLPLIPDQMGQDPFAPATQIDTANCMPDLTRVQWPPELYPTAFVRLVCPDMGEEADHVFWTVISPVNE